jgi:hypothetical protein
MINQLMASLVHTAHPMALTFSFYIFMSNEDGCRYISSGIEAPDELTVQEVVEELVTDYVANSYTTEDGPPDAISCFISAPVS